MNKELLVKRLEELDKSIQQLNANMNVLIGCKAEAQHWLDEIKKSEVVQILDQQFDAPDKCSNG